MTDRAASIEAAARKLLSRFEALDGPNNQTAFYALYKHAFADWRALKDALDPPPVCPNCKGRRVFVSLSSETGQRICSRCKGEGVVRNK